MRRLLSGFASSITLLTLLLMLAPVALRADIFRGDDGQLIPGTEGITPGPGVQLSEWDTNAKNLRYADFSGMNLSNSKLYFSWLDNADLSGTTPRTGDH